MASYSAAAPIPDPIAASAKPVHATAPTISRPDIEVASIVFPLVEFPLATRITLITVVQNSHIRNTARSRFAHNEFGAEWPPVTGPKALIGCIPSHSATTAEVGGISMERKSSRRHPWEETPQVQTLSGP